MNTHELGGSRGGNGEVRELGLEKSSDTQQ